MKYITYISSLLLGIQSFTVFSQVSHNQLVAIEVEGHGYIEYQEREYGINLVWSQLPVYQWQFQNGKRYGVLQANTPLALFNTKTKDYVVYASREYGINLKWLRDTEQIDPFNWEIEGNAGVPKPCIKLKNRTLTLKNEKSYLLYGEREYGINLIWGSRPVKCNIKLLVTADRVRYDHRRTIPLTNPVNQKLFDKITRYQMDILGSDFNGTKFIGMTPAERENVIVKHKNTWFPIDGYRQTICGKLTDYFSYDGSAFGDNDDDLNLNIIPYLNSPSKDLLQGMQAIGWKESGKNDPYKHVQAEIDVIDKTYKPYFYPDKPHAPKKNQDVCAFGPWVMDGGEDHYYKPEIHPAEQIWWKEGSGQNCQYYLSFMCDNSGRFDGLTDNSLGASNTGDDYDTDNGKISFNGPWAPRPIIGTFAIAFKVQSGKEKVFFNIDKISEQNFQSVGQQPQDIHFLIIRSDTIAMVIEPDGVDLNVTFENISQNAAPNNPNEDAASTYIQGYIVLRAKTGKPNTNTHPISRNDDGGQLLLKVTKNTWKIGTPSFTTGFNRWKG